MGTGTTTRKNDIFFSKNKEQENEELPMVVGMSSLKRTYHNTARYNPDLVDE